MKIYKKLIAFGVTAVTALCSTFGSYAEEEQDVSTEARYVVYSEDFPDAYIIVEESTPISLLADNENEVCMGEIEATVFVHEEYAVVDNELIVTSSCLLSKEEVEAIGIENFSEQALITANEWISGGNTYDDNYKCTITMGATYKYEGQGVIWNLYGTGGWDHPGLNSAESPATGLDYIGYSWFGDLEGTNPTAELTWSQNPPASQKKDIKAVQIEPNSAYVWGFDELWYGHINSQQGWVELADVTIQCKKNVLTGGGNRATAVLTYIHTYEQANGSIVVSKTGAGFSLTGVDKQWSFAIQITGLPY